MSAITTLALAYLHNLILVGIALLAGGFVWLATMSSLNAATRRSLLAKTALSASGAASLSHSKPHQFLTALPKIRIGWERSHSASSNLCQCDRIVGCDRTTLEV
jgi:hypothetical protein